MNADQAQTSIDEALEERRELAASLIQGFDHLTMAAQREAIQFCLDPELSAAKALLVCLAERAIGFDRVLESGVHSYRPRDLSKPHALSMLLTDPRRHAAEIMPALEALAERYPLLSEGARHQYHLILQALDRRLSDKHRLQLEKAMQLAVLRVPTRSMPPPSSEAAAPGSAATQPSIAVGDCMLSS